MRGAGVRMKLNPLPENIEGKRLVVVDDSIVRGTTTRQVITMLREAGAAEVHFRVSSPPYRNPCFYGMDTGRRGELLAADLSVGEIREYLGVDSLAYLDVEAIAEAHSIEREELGIQFDTRRFNWIGNTTDGPNVLNSWHTTGITKFEDVLTKELVVGASGTGSSAYTYPAAMINRGEGGPTCLTRPIWRV